MMRCSTRRGFRTCGTPSRQRYAATGTVDWQRNRPRGRGDTAEHDSAALLDQVGAEGGDGQLDTVGHVELVEQVRDMGLDRRLAHVQPEGYLGVGVAEADLHQHLPLPLG